MIDTKQIIREAVQSIIDKYGVDQALELHLEIDGTIDDPFFDELTDRLAELAPEEFNLEGTYPIRKEDS